MEVVSVDLVIDFVHESVILRGWTPVFSIVFVDDIVQPDADERTQYLHSVNQFKHLILASDRQTTYSDDLWHSEEQDRQVPQ